MLAAFGSHETDIVPDPGMRLSCIREHGALAGPDTERKTLIFIWSKPTFKKYERF